MSRLRSSWSSLAHALGDTMPLPAIRRSDLDAAWAGWSSAADKAGFISSLPLPIAQQLTNVIMQRVPANQPTRRARTKKGPTQ